MRNSHWEPSAHADEFLFFFSKTAAGARNMNDGVGRPDFFAERAKPKFAEFLATDTTYDIIDPRDGNGPNAASNMNT